MPVSELRPIINISEISPASNARGSNTEEKRLSYLGNNAVISWGQIKDGDFLVTEDPEVVTFLHSMQALGRAPFSEAFILHAVTYIINRDQLEIPFGDEYKKRGDLTDNSALRHRVGRERKVFFDNLVQKLDFEVSEGQVRVVEVKENQRDDLTEEIVRGGKDRDITHLSSYDSFAGYVAGFFKGFVGSNKGLLVFITKSNPIIKDPTIVIEGTNEQILGNVARSADLLVSSPQAAVPSVLRATIEYAQLQMLQRTLRKGTEEGDIAVVDAFKRNDWPSYGLMEHMKAQVQPRIVEYISSSGLMCDPLDALYQVLFRLTSFNVRDLFQSGETLENFLEGYKRTDGWRGLLRLPETNYENAQLNTQVLNRVLKEQMWLLEQNLGRSKLPLRDILERRGIFDEDGWEIKKDRGQIIAIRRDRNGQIIDSRGVSFREVDPALASQFHQDLHYIHTPRSGQSFGFYLEGEELPFSILALEPVDRLYKRNTLLLFGFDPRYCVDFTRLYSRPGVPQNVSSAIFGETFTYIRQHDPRIEAAISAFMPSYASGQSMLTGGFETPILIKPGVHYFAPFPFEDGTGLEHLTKRRQQNLEGGLLTSRLPLLPVIELISPLKEPRFEPVLKLGEQMVELQ